MNIWIKRGLVVIVLVAVVVPFAHRGVQFYQYQKMMETLEVGEIQLENLEDGIYSGGFDAVLINAFVDVTIEEGRIEDIKLEHEHNRGYRAEVIIRSVLDQQSIQVDTISGATDSSKVILKAIEKALNE